MNIIRKVLYLLILVVLICGFLNTDVYDAEISNKFSVNVHKSYDGVTSHAGILPVSFEIYDVKENFTGSIEIINNDTNINGGKNIEIIEECFSIKKGERTFVNFIIYPSSEDIRTYNIKDNNGNILFSDKIDCGFEVNCCNVRNNFIGIISYSYENILDTDLVYFDISAADTYNAVEKVQIQPADLFDKKAISMLDIIIISDYNVKQLDDGKISVIKEWIDNGGFLIISADKNIHDNLDALKISDDFKLEDYKMRDALTSQYSTLTTNAYKVTSENNIDESIACKEYNKGLVAVAGFDFCDDTAQDFLNSTYDNGFGFSVLITLIVNDIRYFDNIKNYTNVFYFINQNDYFSYTENNDSDFNIISYIIIIILYLFIISIAFYYMVKKRLNRFFYGIIALFSILFAFIIYIMGSSTRIEDNFVQYLNIVHEDYKGNIDNHFNIGVHIVDSEGYTEEYYSDLDLKNNTFYSYKTNVSYGLTAKLDYLYNKMMSSDSIRIKNKGKITELSIENVEPFTTRVFSGEYKNKESIDIQAEIYDDFSGSITNNSDVDIEDIVFLKNNALDEYYYIQCVKAGETVDISDAKILNHKYIKDQKGLKSTNSNMIMSRRYNLLEQIMDSYTDTSIYNNVIEMIYFTEHETEDIYINDSKNIYGITLYNKSIPMIDKSLNM